MDLIERLHELQGDMSQVEFAAILGIGTGTLSMVYARQRFPGRYVLGNILKAFPETKEDVVLFLSSNGQNSEQIDNLVTGEQVLAEADVA